MKGYHVMVEACPGAGKTTLALQIAKQLENVDILILTYNRCLADSTLSKLVEMKLECRVSVYTYHALISSLTKTVVPNDITFVERLGEFDSKTGTDWKRKNFQLLIIDEVQDMRPLFWNLCQHLVYNICNRPETLQILVMGDKNQLLYDFYSVNGADSRFMDYIHILLGTVNNRTWVFRTLSVSFRLTYNMTRFLNAVYDTGVQSVSTNSSSSCFSTHPVVSLYVCNVYKDAIRLLKPWFKKYLPDDIFILTASLNSRSPAIPLVQDLVKTGCHVHVGRSGNLNDVMPQTYFSFVTSKIQAKTFHAGKGLESKCCIVLNTGEIDEKGSPFYVALSRAKEELVVLQHHTRITLPVLEKLASKLDDSIVDIRVFRTLSTRKSNNTKKGRTDPPPLKKLDCSQLFVFLDVSQLLALSVHVTVTTEVDGVVPVHHEFVDNMDTLELTEEFQAMQISDYAKNLVHTTKLKSGEEVHTNVLKIVGDSILLGISYAFKRKLFVPVSKILMNSSPDLVSLCNSSLENIEQPQLDQDDDVTFIQRRLPAFACLATCLDAHFAFPEKIPLIHNFSFVQQPSVFDRVERAWKNLQYLVGKYDKDKVQFNHSCGRKVHDVYFSATIPVVVQGEFALNIVHMPMVDITVQLYTITMGCIVECPRAFILNIYDGSLYRLSNNQDPDVFLKCVIEVKTNLAPALNDSQFIQLYKS